MQRPSIRTTTNASFVSAFVLLLFIATVAYYRISDLAKTNDLVIHAHELREAIQELLSNLIVARSETRAYLLTRNPAYADSYHARSKAALESFDRTWQLTADNPAQQQRLQRLHPILLHVIALLDQESATPRPSNEQLANLFMAVRAAMDQAQAIVSDMTAEEGRLLDQRNERVRVGSRSALLLVFVGALLALLIIIAAMWRINGELTKRQRNDERIARLNSALQLRARELSESNKELAAFTYSVSHDLRAPLRHIEGFSKMLEDALNAGSVEQIRECVTLIRESTSEMSEMVGALLTLDRFSREGLSVQLTGLNSLVDEVVGELKRSNPGRVIEWRIERLPFVECDPRLMKQVFVNLLSNAVKFTRPRERTLIEVGVTRQDSEPVIFVRDNGVGFNIKNVGKLFGVFQRLHRQEDFEGTGVGLATVQRIIHKHGGRVWADAKVDQGATFFVTLGRSEDAGAKKRRTSVGRIVPAGILATDSEVKL